MIECYRTHDDDVHLGVLVERSEYSRLVLKQKGQSQAQIPAFHQPSLNPNNRLSSAEY